MLSVLLQAFLCWLIVLCESDHVDPNHAACELIKPEVQDALRKDLLENNCLKEVEIVSPSEIEWARQLFHRDGFVVIKEALEFEITNN